MVASAQPFCASRVLGSKHKAFFLHVLAALFISHVVLLGFGPCRAIDGPLLSPLLFI